MPVAITLRPATLQDAELLLAWRNDPHTRLSSHDTNEITLAQHLAWLNRVLNDVARRLFIAEEAGTPVGSVRADTEPDGTTVLSWTVAPLARGRGVGKRMLVALLEETSGPVRAEVKIGNTASMRIAESAGLSLIHEEHGVLHYAGGHTDS
ncbi:MAG: GCN5-like N-acetyltransferase [Rhodocyclales bacterium]|nr:GCN5-like N-acetyltransferase [Rhodocyclales bacterium]